MTASLSELLANAEPPLDGGAYFWANVFGEAFQSKTNASVATSPIAESRKTVPFVIILLDFLILIAGNLPVRGLFHLPGID